jgi:hypothetical protein
MSKDLEKAVGILNELIPLPKGKHEEFINVGIQIARNALLIELTNKRIAILEKEIEEIQEQIELESQEKQGL